MASSSVLFESREDDRKQLELEEARKAGLAPSELDEDGKEINPHSSTADLEYMYIRRVKKYRRKAPDRWKGFDPALYLRVVRHFGRKEQMRKHLNLLMKLINLKMKKKTKG